MDEMNTNMELDFRTRTAILTSNPEGVAILGAWDCMKTLAQEDPEGCVRLMPGLSMDMAALAGFLRCPEALVEKTVSIFAKLRRLTVKDGVIRLLSCKEEHDNASGSSVSEEALARKREQWRIRQANRRARLKQAEASGSGNTVTKRDRCDQRDSQRDSQRDRRDNTAMYNRNVDSLHPLHASQAHKPVSPYDQFIPRNELSEEDRNVIDTWNRLPLPKYKGLFPDLRDKLHYLL
ncbi:MAG: hypothetical protein IKO69_06155 [Acidaminococcaceae bacterium]|nr:hypothetical protein [Acidaminococcaceae bacterium]